MTDLSLPKKFRGIQVVGVASGCGAGDQGCEAAPDALRAAHLTARLRARGFHARWAPVIRPPRDRADSIKSVQQVCTRLAQQVERIVHEGDLPVVVGGDHTSAIGTWKGVARAVEARAIDTGKGVARAVQPRGRLGLLWIDAHMDAHTPETTETGNLHGMPVACLLGYGYPELTSIADGVCLDTNCVCLYGVRSFESGEAALLERLGVRIFYMQEIEERGVHETLNEAMDRVSCASGGFGVTLDLDAIDPADAPGVGTPAPGGMRAAELLTGLAEHGGHPDLVGVEIVEYNPYLDQQSATAALVSDALDAILLGQSNLGFTTSAKS